MSFRLYCESCVKAISRLLSWPAGARAEAFTPALLLGNAGIARGRVSAEYCVTSDPKTHVLPCYMKPKNSRTLWHYFVVSSAGGGLQDNPTESRSSWHSCAPSLKTHFDQDTRRASMFAVDMLDYHFPSLISCQLQHKKCTAAEADDIFSAPEL